MADDNQLQLDVIVDDHGGVRTLADVDKGVAKVLNTAKDGAPSMDALNARFAAARERLDHLGTAAPAAGLGLGRMAVVAGVTTTALTFLGGQLRAAAEDADRLSDAADHLDAPASKIQQITTAAAESEVGFDAMTAGLTRLQQRIGSGVINNELRALKFNLDEFRRQDIVEQFLDLSDAIGGIEEPAKRAHMRQEVLGRGSQDMAKIMTTAFRGVTEGAAAMSDGTIRELDEMADAFDRTVERAKTKSKSLVAEGFLGALNLMGRGAWQEAAKGLQIPEPPTPTRPGDLPSLPVPAFDRASADQMAIMLKAAEDLRLEISRSLEVSIEMQGVWLNAAGAIEFVSPIITTIRDAQREIAKDAAAWGETLNTRVLGTLTNITDRLSGIIMSENATQAQLMNKLTSTTDPNQSEFDRRFLAIDQELKDKLANAQTLPTRGAQQLAENEALETANLQVQELQDNWAKVNAQKDAALQKATALQSAYAGVRQAFSGPGQQLPNGLTAPTAEQVASGRYFGPVTAHGDPDLARMGGAAPAVTNININAAGSVNTEGWDSLVRQLDQRLAERQRDRGQQIRR